jgi:hypothetical protein
LDYGYFDVLKEDSEEYFGQTSIRLDLLIPKYLMFCTKNGLRSGNIREEVPVLNRFQLKLEYRESNNTVAYTNLRWRTSFEKIYDSEKKNEKYMEDGKKEINHIKKFIKMYLFKCSFDTDFVLATELQERYDRY